MKVKVGGKTYDAKDVPVMVVLDDIDKENIRNMPPENHHYAAFPEGWFEGKAAVIEWMEEGPSKQEAP